MPDVDDIWTEDDERELEQMLLALYGTVWRATRQATIAALGLDSLTISPKVLAAYLDGAGKRIVGINETTRQGIAARLQDPAARGMSRAEAADHIRGLFEETYRNRHKAIARTEIRNATLDAQRKIYPAAGIEYVSLSDGTAHDICASRNGAIVPADRIPEMAHPNCTLSAFPVTNVRPEEVTLEDL